MTTRAATPLELLAIVEQQGPELERRVAKLVGGPAQLSVPTDGRGLRLHVAVLPGREQAVPKTLTVRFNSADLSLPLEAAGDYQEYAPH